MLTYGFSWCSICYMDTNNHLIDKCLAETYKHIKKVGQFLHLFAIEIIKRSDIHDNSKLEEPELTGFAINTEKLGKVEYGSDEYKPHKTAIDIEKGNKKPITH